jgi:hypothetical protein
MHKLTLKLIIFFREELMKAVKKMYFFYNLII